MTPRNYFLRRLLLCPVPALICALVPASASDEICQGEMAWFCEEHQMFNAEPPASGLTQDTAGVTQDTTPQLPTPPPCLSQKEVRGGYPRYRVINGRHCWYASTRDRSGKQIGSATRDIEKSPDHSVGRASAPKVAAALL